MKSFSFDPPSQKISPGPGMQMSLTSASVRTPRLHGNWGGLPHFAAMTWLRKGGIVGSLQPLVPPPVQTAVSEPF
jgi:hypothetical protein